MITEHTVAQRVRESLVVALQNPYYPHGPMELEGHYANAVQMQQRDPQTGERRSFLIRYSVEELNG